MPIKFNCAKCNKSFTVADTAAGKTGRCSDCGNLNKIPKSGSPAKVESRSGAGGQAMFEVMSSVNGAVFGPAGQSTLKQWVKEDRITPECKIKKVGTDKWTSAARLFPSLADVAPAEAEIVAEPLDAVGNPFDKFKVGPSDGAAIEKRSSASTPVNPFVSSSVSKQTSGSSGVFKPTSGSIGFILRRAFQQYQDNFGTMIGTTFLFIACMLFMVLVFYGFLILIIAVLANGFQPGNPEEIGIGVLAIMGVAYIVFLTVAAYLNTGVLGVMLKIGRGEPANAIDMFSDNNRFGKVLGYGLLVGLVSLGCIGIFSLFISPIAGPRGLGQGPGVGVMLIPMFLLSVVFPLLFWPGVFLIVDGRSGVMGAFSLGTTIAVKNLGQFFVIALVAGLIYMAGAMLLGIGILFSFPLALLIITCAYLNMTSQISE
ncbi:DUF4339 domain-containing protein [bacterium]|nr:DUF4339 domain-containing protein [bacterium]